MVAELLAALLDARWIFIGHCLYVLQLNIEIKYWCALCLWRERCKFENKRTDEGLSKQSCLLQTFQAGLYMNKRSACTSRYVTFKLTSPIDATTLLNSLQTKLPFDAAPSHLLVCPNVILPLSKLNKHRVHQTFRKQVARSSRQIADNGRAD